MLTKNQLKYYSSLLNKKERQEEKKFLVEGKKLIFEAVNSDFKCESIFASGKFADDHPDFIEFVEHKNITLELIKTQELEKLCDTKTPQGITGVFHFSGEDKGIPDDDKLIIALENISDPGNAGTIFRNCDWFGIKNILLSAGCADIYNPKVIRASAGSVFHLNFFKKENLCEELRILKSSDYKIICADLNGENLYKFHIDGKLILALANEANGPTDELLEICDNKITIPRLGEAESLNVASASAVILAELTRKQ
ncbi:MAG: RNA methyltransferase [Melioribacteraceae bacterium]